MNRTLVPRIREIQAEFLAQLPDELHQGQVGRVAKRFALVATALEMSRSITCIMQGMGMLMVQKCFDDWLNRTGAGKQEDLKIIKKMADFMQLNADNGRFAHGTLKSHRPTMQGISGKWIMVKVPTIGWYRRCLNRKFFRVLIFKKCVRFCVIWGG